MLIAILGTSPGDEENNIQNIIITAHHYSIVFTGVAAKHVLGRVDMRLLLLLSALLAVVAKDVMTSRAVAIVTDPLRPVADEPPRLHLQST